MRSWLVAFALLCATPAGAALCPCYSSTSATNPNKCGIAEARGTNPSNPEWTAIIEAVCQGPDGSGWGDGPTILPIGLGCDGSGAKVAAHFPCEIVEAIAMQETLWQQFCSALEPADKKGNPPATIVSKDCGYGVAQVTTGMHQGETPDWDRNRVASDARYALQVGLKILADKWRATACVGNNDPDLVESWYLATWAYNSYSFSNNPNNPNFDAMRTVCNPNDVCTGRPYQEKVWGWMEHPPADGRWTAMMPAYPDITEIPSTSGPKPTNLTAPHCAGPTECGSTRDVHVSRCVGGFPVEDLGRTEGDGFLQTSDAGNGADGGCGCDLGGTGSVPWRALVVIFISIAALLVLRRRHTGT